MGHGRAAAVLARRRPRGGGAGAPAARAAGPAGLARRGDGDGVPPVPGSTRVVPRARSPSIAYVFSPILTVQLEGVDTGR
ncbi:hypothetical protein ACFQ60_12210 [Streptomyces zhihengii]